MQLQVCQLLKHVNVLKPVYECASDVTDTDWDYRRDIPAIFSDPELLVKTCPLCDSPPGIVEFCEAKKMR